MSRNAREGRYVGHAWGKPVRWRGLIKRVRAAKARVVLRRRSAHILTSAH